MFDTMTLTKTAGALCGALLVFLLGGWVSQEIYAMNKGHYGDDHAQGYVIEVEGADEEGATEDGSAEDDTVDFAALYAAAEIDKGERVFNKCKACHKLEAGENSVGPYLYGVVGRDVDTAQDFAYSGALEEVVEVWTPEALNEYLEDPRGYAPGTTMSFTGLNKIEDRANVIAFLDQLDGDMTPLQAVATEEEVAVEPEPAAVEEAVTEEAPAEDAAAEDVVTEEAPAEDAAAEEAVTEEAPAEEAAAEEATSDEAATEEATEATETEMAAEPATEEAATEEAEATEAAAEAETTETAAADDASGFAALVAAADVAAGEKVFNQCKACHVLEAGTNRVGPYLHSVVGRDIASAEGFRYSDALSDLEGDWTYDELSAYLENPREYAPGNRMAYRGLKDEADRAAVIAYIESASD